MENEENHSLSKPSQLEAVLIQVCVKAVGKELRNFLPRENEFPTLPSGSLDSPEACLWLLWYEGIICCRQPFCHNEEGSRATA